MKKVMVIAAACLGMAFSTVSLSQAVGIGNSGFVYATPVTAYQQGVRARQMQQLREQQIQLQQMEIERQQAGYAPSNQGDVYVRGYMRSDGIYVQPHYQSAPNGTRTDNFSTRGNVNPYTGKAGTQDPFPPGH
jgi:hypothetical protein